MMLVKSILDSMAGADVAPTIAGDEYISKAAQILASSKAGALVVVDKDGRIAGIISEHDIVRSLAQLGQAISCLHVAEVMTTEVLICHETDHADRLVKSMVERRVRHVPVVDADHRLINVIAITDLVKSALFDAIPPDTIPLRWHGLHTVVRH